MNDASIPNIGTTTRRWAIGISLAVIALNAGNWILQPDKPMRWLLGMLVIPGAWFAVMLYRRIVIRGQGARGPIDRVTVHRYFDSVVLLLLVASVPLLVRNGLMIWDRLDDSLTADLGQRIMGVSAGVMFLIVGNMMPKILTPLAMLPSGRSGRQQQARRYLGLGMVVLGLVLATASVFGPIHLALEARRWAIVACVVATLAAIVWMNLAPSQPEGQR